MFIYVLIDKLWRIWYRFIFAICLIWRIKKKKTIYTALSDWNKKWKHNCNLISYHYLSLVVNKCLCVWWALWKKIISKIYWNDTIVPLQKTNEVCVDDCMDVCAREIFSINPNRNATQSRFNPLSFTILQKKNNIEIISILFFYSHSSLSLTHQYSKHSPIWSLCILGVYAFKLIIWCINIRIKMRARDRDGEKNTERNSES